MLLSSADRRRIQRALRRKRHEEDPASGELNITPFLDVTVNLILFILATTSVTLTTVEVQARLPSLHPHGRGDPPTELSATLTHEGVVLGTGSSFVRAGCASSGPGATVAVPREGDHAVDVDALSTCAAALHAELDTDTVILSAEPEIAYEEVIRAMDALRASPSGPLFPTVILSAGVR